VAKDLPTARHERLPPDPTGTAETIRRIGYDLDEALADIVDNSVDAKARSVLVRFVRSKNQVDRLVVADDGVGMPERQLHRIMQYGVRVSHAKKDLGKYGIGLKAASLSQCSSVSVISRQDGKTSGRRWTMESIGMDWRVEVIEPKAAHTFFNRSWSPVKNTRHGTLVVWDDLLSPPSAIGDFEKSHDRTVRDLAVGLGVRFHRFLENGKLRIWIDTTGVNKASPETQLEVEALNPFKYPASGRRGYPTTFFVDLGKDGDLQMKAHIWPAKSKDPNYRLGGGQVAMRQGFYFYRNHRLIRAGGWHKLLSDGEPHSSLARVEVDIPPDLDSFFGLTVQKNDFKVPHVFLNAVRRSKAGNSSFEDYLTAAQDTYRNAPDEVSVALFPGEGLPTRAAKLIRKLLSDSKNDERIEISFEWQPLPDTRVFELDRDNHRILLNSAYRSSMTGGRNSKADAPVLKTLMFFAIGKAAAANRLSGSKRAELDLLNQALLVALGKDSRG
jgi:hypothetical protein